MLKFYKDICWLSVAKTGKLITTLSGEVAFLIIVFLLQVATVSQRWFQIFHTHFSYLCFLLQGVFCFPKIIFRIILLYSETVYSHSVLGKERACSPRGCLPFLLILDLPKLGEEQKVSSGEMGGICVGWVSQWL